MYLVSFKEGRPALISKQQAPMTQGNAATHIAMGILAIGKFVRVNVWGGKMLDNLEGFIIISSSP